MKWIISRYNHNVDYLPEYTEDYIMYDRTEPPIDDDRVIPTKNVGSDIYDKFSYIIDNYDNLPPVVLMTKANIFKYISREEFDKMKDNKTFTPILTQNHEEKPGVSRYKNGIYEEINNYWYLNPHPPKSKETAREVAELVGIFGKEYVAFAPGSNYILPKKNILQHPKEFYEKLRSYLSWNVYPGEAQITERGLYNIWK